MCDQLPHWYMSSPTTPTRVFKFLSGEVMVKKMYKCRESRGFSHSSDGEWSACSAGDPRSIPGSGRPPGEWNGYPLQYSCLEDPMDRGAWQAIVAGVAKSRLDTTEQLTLSKRIKAGKKCLEITDSPLSKNSGTYEWRLSLSQAVSSVQHPTFLLCIPLTTCIRVTWGTCQKYIPGLLSQNNWEQSWKFIF